MLIKTTDDKSKDLQILQALAAHPAADANTHKQIAQEIRNIQSGIKGEAEAAYEIEFYYGASKHWMVLHDLRLVCEGRVAQIDHLLINRFLDIYVCESKRFAEGIAINEQGEFSAFYQSKPYGIPSPIEQNKRHMAVLRAVFKSGQVAPPKRLGITLSPTLNSLVLVSKNARIARPKTKVDGLDCIIKNDQLKTRIDREIDESNSAMLMLRVCSSETVEDFARCLAAAHQPASFNWQARFGLSPNSPQNVLPIATEPTATTPLAEPELMTQVHVEVSVDRKSKLACVSCGTIVPYAVAKFCWSSKARFSGKVYCMVCQKALLQPA